MKNKIITLFLGIVMCIASCKQPDGKLSGVVTYSANDKTINSTDIPDSGANIYLVKKVDYDSVKFSYLVLAEYPLLTYSCIKPTVDAMEICKSRTDENAKVDLEKMQNNLDGLWKELKKYGINSVEEYIQFNNDLEKMFDEFKTTQNVKSLIVNGSGSFSTSLEKGTYYILFQSSCKKRKNGDIEVGAYKVDCFTIESGKESLINAKF